MAALGLALPTVVCGGVLAGTVGTPVGQASEAERGRSVKAEHQRARSELPSRPTLKEGWPLLALLSFLALFVPTPFGGWPPVSIILWGLVGDPPSSLVGLGYAIGGVAVCATYALTAYGSLAIGIPFLARLLRRGPRRVSNRQKCRKVGASVA